MGWGQPHEPKTRARDDEAAQQLAAPPRALSEDEVLHLGELLRPADANRWRYSPAALAVLDRVLGVRAEPDRPHSDPGCGLCAGPEFPPCPVHASARAPEPAGTLDRHDG